jgi:hypothetical protein
LDWIESEVPEAERFPGAVVRSISAKIPSENVKNEFRLSDLKRGTLDETTTMSPSKSV